MFPFFLIEKKKCFTSNSLKFHTEKSGRSSKSHRSHAILHERVNLSFILDTKWSSKRNVRNTAYVMVAREVRDV